MATTFDVFYLGTAADIDPTEGNYISENASVLVGNTYGEIGDPLLNHTQSFTSSGAGYGSGSASAYDTDNSTTNDQFSINGGAAQTMDGGAVYDATITYVDGTTATITAVVFQDIAGNHYLAPEMSANTDQAALDAGPIRSLTLDSVITNNIVVGADRVASTYAVCFTLGTAIATPQGDVLIDDLRVGDLITTMDNGPQPICWIGKNHLDKHALLAKPLLRPILIRKEILGARRDLLVSPQHGMLLGRDNLVRAKHLVSAPKSHVRIARGKESVTYVHLMFEAHQIIFAEGVPSESFFPGPIAQRMIDPVALNELQALFPDAITPEATRETVLRSYGNTVRTFLPRNSVILRDSPFSHALA